MKWMRVSLSTNCNRDVYRSAVYANAGSRIGGDTESGARIECPGV